VSRVEIKKYSIFTYANNTARINLYLKDGNEAHLTDLDQMRARLLINILRNEKPVYWNPQSATLWAGREPVGEEESYGLTPIAIKYISLGGEDSFLGKPTTKEEMCADGMGAYRHYEHGSIFWHPAAGAHEIHGAIRAKYRDWNWERSALGYPVTDELDTPDSGRYNRFRKGLIVWTQESGAQGICEDGINLDERVDFERWTNTTYGNLKDFYEKVRKWTYIDLKYNINTQTGEKRYTGWQVANFRSGNYMLNGYELSSGERLVITVAQVLLMQWHLRDLKNHGGERREQISRYFHSRRCFKQRQVLKWRGWRYGYRWVWKYNRWCSEFVSYVYARADMSTSLGKKQCFFCHNIGSYKKIGTCISNVGYFVKYFKNRNRYKSINHYRDNKIPLSLGDYLCRYDGRRPCHPKGVQGHSMLVLGFEENQTNFLKSKIFYINGNSGSGAPEENNRYVKYYDKSLDDRDLTGVGEKTVSF
jgi:hypothetical protein